MDQKDKNKNVDRGEVVETRADMAYITDVYLTATCHMVASQFICSDTTYESREDFKAKATYVLRQHCPIAYSYYFEQAGLETLPEGTVGIILNMVKAIKPDFLLGSGLIGRPKLILP
jgi:hypothetical protein